MNTEFESYASTGEVRIHRRKEGEPSEDLLPGGNDGDNGGQLVHDVGYSVGYCNDPDIRAVYDGVWLELSSHHLQALDKISYSVTMEARLTWRQAAQLHDYLGMLLRQVPHSPRGEESTA